MKLMETIHQNHANINENINSSKKNNNKREPENDKY